MKKIIALLTVVLMLSLALNAVYADEICKVNVAADATDLATGKTFVLNISIDDVTVADGLCVVQMYLVYDPAVFSIEGVESVCPESWVENPDFEDWSTKISDGKYMLCTLNSAVGLGAKSGELGFNVTMKALKDSADGATLKLTDISVASDDLKNRLEPLDVSFVVNYGEKTIDYTVDTSSDPSSEPDEDESGSIFDDPSEPEVSEEASADEVSSESASSDVSEPEEGSDNTLVIVLAVVAAVAVAAGVLLFLQFRKK